MIIVTINNIPIPTPIITPNSCNILIFVMDNDIKPTAVVKLVKNNAEPIFSITTSKVDLLFEFYLFLHGISSIDEWRLKLQLSSTN